MQCFVNPADGFVYTNAVDANGKSYFKLLGIPPSSSQRDSNTSIENSDVITLNVSFLYYFCRIKIFLFQINKYYSKKLFT